MPELIYCAGKNAAFERIARDHGYRLGVRLPGTLYHPPAYFADQDWRKPDRAAYMRALAEHRPTMATVLDLEWPEQLGEVLSWAEEAAQHAERVLIIPKYSSAVDALPRRIGDADVVLAFSVPTAFGGTSVPVWEFQGWPVHLLGGSPQAQMRYARYMDVVSVDGNMANKMAHRCRFWCATPGGAARSRWWMLADAGLGHLRDGANAEAFRLSCRNIRDAWRAWAGPAPLPGPDWAETAPYREERGRTAPALVRGDDGRVWRYVGGLAEGEPRYAEEVGDA